MNRGMFYTIGFFLLALVILGLAVLFAKTSTDTLDIVSKTSALGRANEISVSIQNGFKKILNEKAGITFTKGADFISFQEDLANGNAADFSSEIDDYKELIDSKNISVTLNVNDLKTALPLIVLPHDVEYRHVNFGDSVITVTAKSTNFAGYDLTITTSATSVSCSTSGAAQSVYLSVTANGVGDSCSLSTRFVQRIDVTDGATPIASFDLSGDDLTITANQQVNIKTIVEGMNPLGDVSIVLPEDLLSVYYQDFGLEVNSTAKIL